MLIIHYLGPYFPMEICAKYALGGETGITLFDEHDIELMEISYDVLISITAK